MKDQISVAIWISRFTGAAKVARGRAMLSSAWRTSLSPRLCPNRVRPRGPGRPQRNLKRVSRGARHADL